MKLENFFMTAVIVLGIPGLLFLGYMDYKSKYNLRIAKAEFYKRAKKITFIK